MTPEQQRHRILELEHQNELGAQQNERMREVLEWLDRIGGLGFDAHERIRRALAP